MLRLQSIAVALLAYCVIAAGLAAAAAPKRLTYEQAWTKCKAQLDKSMPSDQHTAKASAGSSCMLRYGYRI